jgi:hypothetical protein
MCLAFGIEADLLKHHQMRQNWNGFIVQIDLQAGRKIRLPGKQILSYLVTYSLQVVGRYVRAPIPEKRQHFLVNGCDMKKTYKI